jgi:ATP-binding cassette subfamily B protein
MHNVKQDPKPKAGLSVLLPLIGYVRPYKKAVAMALLALFFTAAVSLSIGQGVKMVIDQGFIARSKDALASSISLLAIMIVLMAVGSFVRFYFMSWIGERAIADIRKAVFQRLIYLHPAYFEDNRSGEIMSRLTTDTTLLQSVIGSSFSMALRSALMLIGGVAMLIYTNVKLTTFVLAGVPVVLLPIIFYGRRVRHLSRRSQDTIADVGTYAGEIIQNIKVVQSYTREALESNAFGQEVETAFKVAKKRIQQRALLIACVILLVFTTIALMLWVGGNDVLTGTITGGELGAFVFYAIMVASSVGTISEVFGELQRAAGAAERLFELLSVESEIQVPTSPKTLVQENIAAIDSQSQVVSFQQVHFAYPSRPDDPALYEIDFEVQSGQTVALVGPSGAGKSTLFELLQRFYDPSVGKIKIYGTDIRHLSLGDLRSVMGLVPQDPVLFSSNVWRNIRYGDPEASDERVIEAARRAHIHDFVATLPNQYDSELGERGVRLSGGQKQRIAIARAILKDPEILLLDEATSALDSESEKHVQGALTEVMHGRTTLIIAHRLSTVMHADLILLIDQGKIIARGTHEVLVEKSDLYRRLCELQFDPQLNSQTVDNNRNI